MTPCCLTQAGRLHETCLQRRRRLTGDLTLFPSMLGCAQATHSCLCELDISISTILGMRVAQATPAFSHYPTCLPPPCHATCAAHLCTPLDLLFSLLLTHTPPPHGKHALHSPSFCCDRHGDDTFYYRTLRDIVWRAYLYMALLERATGTWNKRA